MNARPKIREKNMNKKLILVTVTVCVFAGAGTLQAENVFDRECVACHVRETISLRKTFMNALLIYSGKENMKAGIKYFLRHPRRDSSVMGEEFLTRHGLKEPLKLEDAALDQALEIYWKRYTVHGKLH
jgi:hypothetical protein